MGERHRKRERKAGGQGKGCGRKTVEEIEGGTERARERGRVGVEERNLWEKDDGGDRGGIQRGREREGGWGLKREICGSVLPMPGCTFR